MSVEDLINAIASGSAVETEQAFNSVMAEKISARLDDMRVEVAQNMFQTESIDSRELTLHADNTQHLYTRSYVPIAKNLEKKFKKGTYDHEKAQAAWKHHADRAADDYAKEHGTKGQKGHHIFSVSARKEAAKEFANAHKAEMEAGNFHESTDYEEDLYLEDYTKESNDSHGYVAFGHDGRRTEIFASSSYEAHRKALDYFKPPKTKKHLVSVHLAQKDGKDVINTAT